MKVRIFLNNDEKRNKIFLEAENAEETTEIIEFVKTNKKQVHSHGSLNRVNGMAWAWIFIPRKNMHAYDALKFNNGEEK